MRHLPIHEILHSFAAIGAGFLLIALLTAGTTGALRKLAPSWSTPSEGKASRAAMFANLFFSALFGSVGGVLAAFLAPGRPLLHAMLLALVVLVISALAAFELRHTYPAWYQAALLALAPMATLGGGILEVLYR